MKFRPFFLVLSGGIFFVIILFSCQQKESTRDDSKEYASLVDSTKYVGITTCRQCHADKFETFMHTGMGLSFDHASKKKSSANFSGHDVIYDKFKNLYYHPYWENDSLMLREFRIEKGDTIYKREEKLSWIVGSGQHTNSHMVNFNGYVYQAPATFYTQKKQWDLPPGFEGGFNSRFSRIIGLECMSCHNAYPDFVPGSENKYNSVPNGIDCERCHGPGGTHVKEKLAGHLVEIDKEIDYSIVNPSKLPINLQIDVCQRCHIQGNAILSEGKSFLDFRPGMHLSEVMNVYMPVIKGDDNSHIMASHAERMKMSMCFLVSVQNADRINKEHPSLYPYKNAMTCITCHDPHVSVRLTDQSIFNNKCVACHTENSSSGIQSADVSCTEDIKIRMKVNDNCVKCHMPKNNTIDIPHVTTTDHWIRVPVKKKELNKIREFAGLVCINNPEAGDKTKGIAFLSFFEKFSSNPAYLDSAKKYINDNNKDSIAANFRNLVRWAFLKNDFKKVVDYTNAFHGALNTLNVKSYSNDDAWTAYRIGESYINLENTENAVYYFQKSVDLAPFQLDFRNKLAGAQHDLGQIENARKNYEFIIKENPKYVSAWINLGYLTLSADKDAVKAEKMYDTALSLDPDNIQAFFNKAGIMIFLGENNKARVYLNEVVKREKNNEKALFLLNELKKGHAGK